MKGPLFYSKILLFGEYGIIKDSKGLSIPYNFYNGALKVSENQSAEALKSNQSLLKFADYLNQLQQEKPSLVCFNLDLLNADLARASDLQRYGVDLAEAKVGYQAIAERLPRGQELSNIYKESKLNYTQDVAEEEQYKGTASAKRAREKLYGLEAASFSKETGMTPTSLTTRRSGAY